MAERRKPACRLFVIMAAEASVAAVLRRGPSAWYHVIRWDTAKDEFEHGAWIRARLYEDRCDVSPDGTVHIGVEFAPDQGALVVLKVTSDLAPVLDAD